MKSSFIVSIHAIEKYLDARIIHVSVFFNQHIMYEKIWKCLNWIIEYGIVIVRPIILPRIKSWIHWSL